MTRMVIAITMILLAVAPPVEASDIAVHRKQAMAVENIELARTHCGHEITARAAGLIAADRQAGQKPFAEPRASIANLWRQTWRCDPGLIGESCMAARLQLCRRAYEEYGPDGILVPGLIRAIIKK